MAQDHQLFLELPHGATFHMVSPNGDLGVLLEKVGRVGSRPVDGYVGMGISRREGNEVVRVVSLPPKEDVVPALTVAIA